MTDPTAEPSQRDQIARALAEKFTSDHQPNPKFDRKREAAWFDAGNPDEEPANSAYMPVPMAERMRRDLMVTYTAADWEPAIRPVTIPEVVEVVAAVRDTEMEQLRAERDRLRIAWRSAARGRRHARIERDDFAFLIEPDGECRPDCDCGDHQGPRSCCCHMTGEEAREYIRSQERELDEVRAELVGMRERAETAIDLIDEYDGPYASFEDHPKWAAVREQLRAAPEPATPPKRYRIDGPYANGFELVDTADTVLGTYASRRMIEVERDRLERKHRGQFEEDTDV